MPYDKDGKMLWLADDTGGFEILQPGGGYNGRTREPGEPDWWVVAKDPKWQPPGMMLAGAQEDGAAGWGSTTEPQPGKLARADSEAGRKAPPAEPWSLLSATQEHLEHLDGLGFGEAVTTIGKGVGKAVGKTWDALTTNEDLKKGVEFGGKAAWEVTGQAALLPLTPAPECRK